jgi:hypothetical protein
MLTVLLVVHTKRTSEVVGCPSSSEYAATVNNVIKRCQSKCPGSGPVTIYDCILIDDENAGLIGKVYIITLCVSTCSNRTIASYICTGLGKLKHDIDIEGSNSELLYNISTSIPYVVLPHDLDEKLHARILRLRQQSLVIISTLCVSSLPLTIADACIVVQNPKGCGEVSEEIDKEPEVMNAGECWVTLEEDNV